MHQVYLPSMPTFGLYTPYAVLAPSNSRFDVQHFNQGPHYVQSRDAFYDRGSTFPLRKIFSEWRGSLTQHSRNANLVSEDGVFVNLDDGIVRRDAFVFFIEVSFRVRYGAP